MNWPCSHSFLLVLAEGFPQLLGVIWVAASQRDFGFIAAFGCPTRRFLLIARPDSLLFPTLLLLPHIYTSHRSPLIPLQTLPGGPTPKSPQSPPKSTKSFWGVGDTPPDMIDPLPPTLIKRKTAMAMAAPARPPLAIFPHPPRYGAERLGRG